MSSRRELAVIARWGAVVCVCLAAFQSPASAYLKMGGPWTKVSPDARYLLVMLPKPSTDPARSTGPAEKELRATHPRSGVYCNDDSRKLIWGIDGYCYPGDVYFSPDGRQVVIAGCEASVGAGTFTIAFLDAVRDPRVLSFFKCVPFPRAKGLISYRFLQTNRDKFDPDALTYTVWSEMGERFTFDVRTGTLRDVSSPWHRCAAGVLTCLMAMGAVLTWWLIRRSQDRKHKTDSG